MENNALKGEANLKIINDKSKNDNIAAIMSEKFKNKGILTINQIYENSKDSNEIIINLSSEYIKLQSDFLNLRQELLSYIENNNQNEIPVRFGDVANISVLLDNSNVNYKVKYHKNDCPIFLVNSIDKQNMENFNKIFFNFLKQKGFE